MNDGFKGCVVDQCDDRGAKGPSNFRSVLGCYTVIAMPAHLSFPAALNICMQGKFIGSFEFYVESNEGSYSPTFNMF